MSTSLRRFAGSIATRKVMGWSFPMTLPTWAKPSSESPAEIRSTAALSTWSVSTRACGPNSRTMEAATLVGGGAWIMSELIPDAETQHVGRAGPGLVAQQLVVALERRVVGRLVRETERGDAPRERLVLGRAGGNGGLCVVPLVPHERVQLLGRRRGERVKQVVRGLEVAAGDPAADRAGVARVDRLGIAHPVPPATAANRDAPATAAALAGSTPTRAANTP